MVTQEESRGRPLPSVDRIDPVPVVSVAEVLLKKVTKVPALSYRLQEGKEKP